jgi:hypothetical protein
MMNSSFPLNNDFRGPLKEDRWFETEKQKDLLREGQGETAGNLGPEYELISNSQDIAATLESIGRADEIDDWGCLFVKVGDGDYDAVYGCEASTPLNSSRVYDLLGNGDLHQKVMSQKFPGHYKKGQVPPDNFDRGGEEGLRESSHRGPKKNIKENIMEGKEVRSFEIHDHGIDHAQYFQGHGLSHSNMEATATGVGDDYQEALDDALGQLAQEGWTNLEMIEQSEAMEGTGGSVSAEVYEQARDEVLAEHPEFIDPLTDDVAEQYVDELEDLITELMQNSESELNYYVSVDVSSQPGEERPFEESTSWDKDSSGRMITIREGLKYDPLKEAYPMGDERGEIRESQEYLSGHGGYTPHYMKRWKADRDYGGEDMSDYYILYGTNRDADLLTQTNFNEIEKDFDGKEGVEAHRFGHWAVGWTELILVHKDSPFLKEADEVAKSLQDYPVYDEGAYSEAQVNQVKEDWESYGKSDSIHTLDEITGETLEDGSPEWEAIEPKLYEIFQDTWFEGSGNFSWSRIKAKIQKFVDSGEYDKLIENPNHEEHARMRKEHEPMLPGMEESRLRNESSEGKKALKEGTRDRGLDEVVAHVMKEMPPEVKEAIGAARWNLEFGPSGGGSALGWQEALDVIRPWAQDLGTVYYDYEIGAISDLFPEGGEDENGEWSEYNGDWYEYEPREILRGIMGELASYVESAPPKGQALKESRQILEIRMMDKGFGIFDRSMRGSKPIAKAKTWQEAREKIMKMLRDDQTPTWARGEGSLQKVLDRRRSS